MRKALGVVVVLMLVLVAQMAYAGPSDYDLFLEGVELRPGVTSDIHVKVFVNGEQPPIGKTVFAIPGWNCTAETWGEYAEALFAHPFKGVKTSQLAAIDLPGHGQSTVPTGLYFGQLLLDDYVTAILGTLDGLRGYGVVPQVIAGYSQGGLLVQMLQQRLVESGSSLFDEYRISRAVLLAPAPPAAIKWHTTTDGTYDVLLACFQVTEGPDYERLWRHFHLPEYCWPSAFFTNFLGEVSPDTPTPEEIVARGYRAPAPIFSSLQQVGYDHPDWGYFPRPEVSPGIFGLQSGTLLHVVGFEDDTMVYATESTAVFDHLVAHPSPLSRNTIVEAEGDLHDRVHGLPISNPSAIIEAMSEHGWFLW